MIDPKIKNNGNGDDDEVDDDVDDMEDDATKTGEHTHDDEIDEIDDDEWWRPSNHQKYCSRGIDTDSGSQPIILFGGDKSHRKDLNHEFNYPYQELILYNISVNNRQQFARHMRVRLRYLKR